MSELTQELSLYQIESEMLELIELRETAEDPEDIAVIDERIAMYFASEVKKVDNVAKFLRYCEARAIEAAGEMERARRVREIWNARADRVEQATIAAMQHFNMPRLNGDRASLKLQGNPPSVEIAQPDLIPHDYSRAVVKMPARAWSDICIFFTRFRTVIQTLAPGLENVTQCAQVQIEPQKSALALALKGLEDCEACFSSGAMPGPNLDIPCVVCGGKGKVPARVPGARLVTDKQRLVVE